MYDCINKKKTSFFGDLATPSRVSYRSPVSLALSVCPSPIISRVVRHQHRLLVDPDVLQQVSFQGIAQAGAVSVTVDPELSVLTRIRLTFVRGSASHHFQRVSQLEPKGTTEILLGAAITSIWDNPFLYFIFRLIYYFFGAVGAAYSLSRFQRPCLCSRTFSLDRRYQIIFFFLK